LPLQDFAEGGDFTGDERFLSHDHGARIVADQIGGLG